MRNPAIIISGMLGCGKTTLVRNIVAENPGLRFGVIVNEFGEMGVDGDLLSPFVPDVVEIRNGCICCVTQDQLVPAIKEVITRYAVDVLLIEMSGAADSTPVAQQVASLAPLVELCAHIVMADCTFPADLATRERSFCNALGVADIIVLSKTDIAAASDTADWIKFLGSFNSNALVLDGRGGEMILDRILADGRSTSADRWQTPHAAGQHGYASVCEHVGPLAESDIARLVIDLGAKIVRMKGIVHSEGSWCEIQVVRGTLRIEPYLGTPPGRGRLVFISNVMLQSSLRRAVKQALREPRHSTAMASPDPLPAPLTDTPNPSG